MTFFKDAVRTCLRFRVTIAVIFIGCIFVARASSQDNDFEFERLGLEQGLSQNTVNCIYQDRFGFLWIGTNDGLNLYDGYHFKIYRVDPDDATSLNNNLITAICEDSVDRDVLWIGTYDGGLNRFDRERQQFEHFGNSAEMSSGLAENRIASLLVDRSGTLWIGTHRRGLYKYDRVKQEFTRYQSEPDNPGSLSSNSITSILEASSGELWIGTLDGGLNRFDSASQRCIPYKNEPGNPNSLSNDQIRAVFQDKIGKLWLGTNDGLNYFDVARESFERFKNNPADQTTLGSNSVRTIREDSQGLLWVGTDKGLNIYDHETGRFDRFVNVQDDPSSLSHDIITTIYEDKSGLIWIGTWGGGLNKYDPYLKKFRHYSAIPNTENSLSLNTVTSFCDDSSGSLWIGTWGGGLDKLDRVKSQFAHFPYEPGGRSGLSDDVVLCLYDDGRGAFWIGTENGGLNKFDKENGGFTVYKNDPDDLASLSNDTVVSIHESHSMPGVLWIATYGGGLNKLEIDDETFTRFDTESGDLINDFARILYEDTRGNLWLGTEAGLTRIDIDEMTFSHFQHQPGNPESLSNNWVLSILDDGSGSLWVGTYGGGLNKFDPRTGVCKRYSEKSGLPNDVVYGILADGDGYLWLSTNRGLAKFDPRNETCRSYRIDEGLQSYEFSVRAYYKSGSGEMFFGGVNGFNAFYPEEVGDNPFIPPIVITDLKIFNESITPRTRVQASNRESPLTKPIAMTNSITLSHKDNVFSFEFAALHYSAPSENQFEYMMEGFDKDWVHAGTRNNATYTNLDPGEYVMHVRGSNSDGVWNEKGASLDIIITPPFWQRWWFRIASVLCLFSAAFLWYKQRVRNIESQKKKLEILVEERTREVKEREAQLIQSVKMSVLGKLTASVAHEINNPIGTIMSNTDIQLRCLDKMKEIQNGMGAEYEKLLRILRNNSELTLSASSRIAKIVKSLKSFTRMGDTAPDKVDINEGLDSVVTLLQYDIRDEIEIVKQYAELPKIVCYPSEINQVFMTLLQNAYQSIEKQGTITIVTSSDEKNIYVKIADTGKGMTKEKAATLFELNFSAMGARMGVGLGLPNAHNIIKKHKGQIQVETAPGEGTEFTITLPRRVDDRDL